MRIRYKKWARKELEESKFYRDNPQNDKEKWKTVFQNDYPIHLELGCGKGNFISHLAVENLTINYIAIDIVDAMLGLAKRKIEEVYKEKQIGIQNVILTRYDISSILNIMDKKDGIDRIYINFCNPWPKGKHRKKRLTHDVQLEKYKSFLNKGAYIYFKTDDDPLFEDSLKYFGRAGFEIEKVTYDLKKEDNFWGDISNIETEHEAMFHQEGIKIKACKVKLK